jgi:hypothetical protein
VTVAVPQRLGSVAVAGLVPISLAEANALLVEYGHYLGPCNRPFRSEGWALDVMGDPVAVAITSSVVSPGVAGYGKTDVVELARLAAREPWATRVTLRLWREVAAPRYLPWTPRAAVAYSQNDRHEGRIYRFDGWTKINDRAGSSGGGAWSRKRSSGDAVHGQKTLWLWEYPA